MSHVNHLKRKILDQEHLRRQLAVWKFLGKRIVFTNGCFDLIHPGHVDYLCRAADFGDVLIVGVNSDSSVRGLDKGAARPIQDEQSRLYVLAGLHVVDAVVLFSDPTPFELIRTIEPDVLVKGGDWPVDKIVGADIVKKKGGEVHSIDLLPGFSTTAIEAKIKKAE